MSLRNLKLSERVYGIQSIYGCVSSGTQWRFLQLQNTTLTIDLNDYSLHPIDRLLSDLVWMAQN